VTVLAAMGQNEPLRFLPFFVLAPGALVAVFVGAWLERRR